MADAPPSRWARGGVALAIGILAGLLCGYKAARQDGSSVPVDFAPVWSGARLLVHGVDPWRARLGSAGWHYDNVLFYPAPALLALWPVHALALPIAAGITLGIASALLAWAVTDQGWWRLWILGTPSFIVAVAVGQWSPVLVAATLLPALGCLLAVKPTLGLACWCYRPTWQGALGVAGIGLVTLALWPHWLPEWLANLHSVAQHPAPIALPFGWLLGLALFRWRTPEARLLLAMACVPQLLFFADQLPLGLIARTRGELVTLSAASTVAVFAWYLSLHTGDLYVVKAAPYVMAGCYLPALVIVLRRANVAVASAVASDTMSGTVEVA